METCPKKCHTACTKEPDALYYRTYPRPGYFLMPKIMSTTNLIPVESVSQHIFIIRGVKVMLDADLAELYQVPTMRLNQAVKRNTSRFPPDFVFQLDQTEKTEVITKCDNLSRLKFSHHLPYAFTEHGVAMLSAVLKSERAIQMSVFIVRAFIKMRELLASNKELGRKIEDIEREQKLQNSHINAIYRILDKLTDEPVKTVGKMGFN